MVASRASSAGCALCFQTFVRPYWRQAEWSSIRNSTCPLSATMRRPVMTHVVVQFSGTVFVRYGRASPACFTDRQVTLIPGDPSPSPLNRTGKKVSCSSFSTVPKASLMPGVTRCTNDHSCWSDFCSLAQADCE